MGNWRSGLFKPVGEMNLKSQKEKLERELKEVNEKIEKENNKLTWIKIPELKIEVEKDLHYDMNTTSKIKIPKGCRLLEVGEFFFIYNNYQNSFIFGKDEKERVDEFLNQPINSKKENYPFVNCWFGRPVGASDVGLGCRNLGNGDRAFGVRFCRRLK